VRELDALEDAHELSCPFISSIVQRYGGVGSVKLTVANEVDPRGDGRVRTLLCSERIRRACHQQESDHRSLGHVQHGCLGVVTSAKRAPSRNVSAVFVVP
jgi:hypothetical protein